MTRRALPPLTQTLAFAGGLALSAAVAAPAAAQGTTEQREACTADAISLCSDTIPDVDKTTICMKAHAAQLSRRCYRVVMGEPEAPAVQTLERRRVARVPRAAKEDLDRPRRPSRSRDDDYGEARRAPSDRADRYDAPRRYSPDPDEAYEAPRPDRRGPDEAYDAPDPDEGYGGPRHFAPGPDESYDAPRRVERDGPYDPYADGYGPRRYLYLSPRGPAGAPDDAD